MANDRVDLSIVIVSYNTCSILRACLASLRDTADPSVVCEVWVVDNASRDGSAEMVSRDFAEVHLLVNADNHGFAAANNQALVRCSGRYVMLLNSDTIMLPGTLAGIVRFMDQHPRAAVVGCKLLDSDGSLQPSITSFPTLTKDLVNMALRGNVLNNTTSTRRRLAGVSRALGISMSRFDTHTDTKEIDFPRGACLTARRAAIDQVGLLDEQFFFTGEEADWCFRMKRAGWQVFYYPEVAVVHLGQGSTSGPDERRYLQVRKSSLLFMQKHYSRAYVSLSKALLSALLLARVILDSLRLALTRDRAPLLRRREMWWSQLRLYLAPAFRAHNMLSDPLFRHIP